MTAYIELWNEPLGTTPYIVSLVVAALVTEVLGIIMVVARGLPWKRVAICMAAMTCAAVLGARLLHAASNWILYENAPGSLIRGVGYFSLPGGLILASVVGILVSRALKIKPWALADALAPAVAIGIAIARLGCFLNGCCFGRTTALPWAVKYPEGSPVHIRQMATDVSIIFHGAEPVHPTQIYELIASIIAAFIAAWILHRRPPAGVASLGVLIWFAGFRLFNDELRVRPSTFSAPEYLYPLVYTVVIMAASLMLISKVRMEREPAPLS